MQRENNRRVISGMQSEAGVPPIKYYKEAVDVQIRIYPDGLRYGIDISAVGQMCRFSIDLTSQDLMSLNKQFQEILERLCTMSPDEIGVNSRDTIIRSLAELGHFAFKKIFVHTKAKTDIQKLFSNKKKGYGHIQITSEDFFLPWELLYPENLKKKISLDNFLGRNYIISRVIVQRDHRGSFVEPTIVIKNKPKLGLLTYMDLEEVKKKEVPFFENLDTQGKVILLKLRQLDPLNRLLELEAFKKFLKSSLNIAHFACHVVCEDEIPGTSHIVLSDEFPIGIQDFTTNNIRFDGYPLIFLNACKTGNINSLTTFNFAKTVWERGARGVVATEWAIQDSFAADFAIQFYIYFLNGMSLGESLLAARRYFLEKNNPGGLLYSLYAHPSIRLEIRGNKSVSMDYSSQICAKGD